MTVEHSGFDGRLGVARARVVPSCGARRCLLALWRAASSWTTIRPSNLFEGECAESGSGLRAQAAAVYNDVR
jgi:hypothetical protein